MKAEFKKYQILTEISNKELLERFDHPIELFVGQFVKQSVDLFTISVHGIRFKIV